MSQVAYNGLLLLSEMGSAFPLQRQPPFAQTDWATNLTPNSTTDLQELKSDRLLNCAYTQPLFVPHNQINMASATITDDNTYVRSSLPNVNWTSLNLSGPGGIQAFAAHPWSYQHFDMLCKDETQAANMFFAGQIDPAVTWPGFTFWFTKNHWHFADGSTTAATWELQFNVVVTNGDGSQSNYLYSLLGGTGQWAKLRRSLLNSPSPPAAYTAGTYTTAGPPPNGTPWKVLNSKVLVGSNPLNFLGNSNPETHSNAVLIEVLAFNGRIAFALGGQTTPFITVIPNAAAPVNGAPIDISFAYPNLQAVQFIAQNWTQLQPHFHPVKFAAQGYYVSDDLTLGFAPDDSTPPYAHIYGLTKSYMLQSTQTATENGGTLEWDSLPNGTVMQYKVQITNPTVNTYNGETWANDTAAFVRTTTRIDGLHDEFPYVTQPVIPREIYEVISFDLASLSISHQLYVTLDNWLGIDYWNQSIGLRGFGNIGVSMRMGWQHQGLSPYDGLPGYQHFYGYCDTYEYIRPDSNLALLRMSCQDQMGWLSIAQVNPPNMDRWNHYYAIAWLALKAGIQADQLAFIDLVPNDPEGFSPNDPAPYFLPSGEGMHPWTPRDRVIPVLELMQFIRQSTGFLLFIDAYGFLRYEPLIPPLLNPIKKTFVEYGGDFGYGIPGGMLNQMRTLNLRNSTRETRNQLALIGIDSYGPDWSPIVQKREDSASIYVPPGYTPPANFCGFPKPMAWMDSRFANVAFASQAADQIFSIISLPDYTCNLSGWLQPEFFPMDSFYANDPKSNSFGIPFFVLQVINHMSTLGSNIILESTLNGKFLI